MGEKVLVSRITNANVYLEDNSLLGRLEECELDDLKVLEEEHKALGMVGKIKLPVGFDSLSGKLKWAAITPAIRKIIANPFQAARLQLRANIQVHGSKGLKEEQALVLHLTVNFTAIPLGKFSQHGNPDRTSAFTATYVKEIIAGEETFEFDYFANTFRIGGADQLATYNDNIGG